MKQPTVQLTITRKLQLANTDIVTEAKRLQWLGDCTVRLMRSFRSQLWTYDTLSEIIVTFCNDLQTGMEILQ